MGLHYCQHVNSLSGIEHKEMDMSLEINLDEIQKRISSLTLIDEKDDIHNENGESIGVRVLKGELKGASVVWHSESKQFPASIQKGDKGWVRVVGKYKDDDIFVHFVEILVQASNNSKIKSVKKDSKGCPLMIMHKKPSDSSNLDIAETARTNGFFRYPEPLDFSCEWDLV